MCVFVCVCVCVCVWVSVSVCAVCVCVGSQYWSESAQCDTKKYSLEEPETQN